MRWGVGVGEGRGNNSICIEQRRHCVNVKWSVCNVSLSVAGKHELYSFQIFSVMH